MTIFYIFVALLIGMAIGVLLVCMFSVNDPLGAEDTARLNAMEALKWQASYIDGRWAVLREIGGKMSLICKPQSTLRSAIDAAQEPKRG